MKYLLIVLMLFPVAIVAQRNNELKLSSKAEMNSRFAKGWIKLDSGWKFKAGDNPDWAKPGFDDASWQSTRLFRGSSPLPAIPENGIAWFRLRFTADSTLQQALALRIYQSGPSEVYLDGKLIYKLGNISSSPDSIKLFSPNFKNLSFPALNGEQQTLCVRFLNLYSRFPVFFNSSKPFFESWITTVDKAQDDYIVRYYKTYTNRISIGTGAATILSVLFFSLFVFFPAQKINLYFALTVFCLTLFLILLQFNLNYQGAHFIPGILQYSFIVLFITGLYFCVYNIFNQKTGWLFRALIIAGIVSIPVQFFIPVGAATSFLVIAILGNSIWVNIKSLPKNKMGGRIILTGLLSILVYLLLSLLSELGIITIAGFDSLEPFAFLIPSFCLAIYLGYSFGITSQSLRQKLAEVEQLSNEKQQILSVQNVTLETQVQERTSALNQSLENLKSTQTQLIQSEKMASLGELTAGIAHEIQNPLNFVNNFSEVNTELIDELNEEADKGNLDEVKAIAKDIKENEQKINHHGKRADAIVKGMLQHSRSSSSVKEPTDINALADEYLRLCYHGLRAKDKSFNATIKTDFDNTIGKISII
ncbi:MAG: hypothetical protein ABIO55_12945, partial [Ginsengibacter sp.]